MHDSIAHEKKVSKFVYISVILYFADRWEIYFLDPAC